MKKIVLTILAIAIVASIGFFVMPAPTAPGEVVSSDRERDTSPDIDDEAFTAFTRDNRDFSFALVDQLRAGEGDDANIFVSPHSVSSALAMLYAGADDATREQMADTLRFVLADDELHSAFNRLDLALDERTKRRLGDDGDPFELSIVNRAWGQRGLDYLDTYLDRIALDYGASITTVDFTDSPDQIRNDINTWVEEQTHDRIQNLLADGSISPDTRFLLVNAIYFYGSWQHPFDEDDTEDRDFHRLDDTTTEVPTMYQEESFGYFRDDQTVGVSLPYVGGDVSLIGLMPAEEDADFPGWDEQFDRAAFDEFTDEMESREVRVYFPKFEAETDYQMSEPLKAMGMVDAFDDCDADFSGITGIEPCTAYESLYLSEIFHQTFISIDEEATEAAAATAGVMQAAASAEQDPTPVVRFDRPFHYVIYDHDTETILFYGRMVDPSR